ncbi:MAG TPA: ABC transporter ATP-binding protein [Candidatus Methylomirabilis sp.]|jgi:phospholipid/cholesterol/gamma-HCH transport system ATP-binding protein|nr:ABC transporter ATP-binding protein [Candidatus Methylomirabilis sp.]
MRTPAIRLAGVRKTFDSQAVLQGVDLEVAPGETITIIGGSGTGKSVLLRLIIGLIKPDAGQIWIDGEEITPLPEAKLLPIRRKVGMLFQGSALFDSLTVAENIAFPLREHTRMGEGEIRDRVREVLELVGLPGVEEKEPAELSGGMKKRVGLARAIALQPRIILYDEPTTGLDPSNIEKITELITNLKEKLGVTSVVVTHDMQSAFKVSDRIAMLHQGRIAVAGTVAEIEHSDLKLVREFISGHLEAS